MFQEIERFKSRNDSWYGRFILRCVLKLPIKYQVPLWDWHDDRLNKKFLREIESPRLATNRWRHRVVKFFTPWIKRVGDLDRGIKRTSKVVQAAVADNPFQVLANVVTRDQDV